jgi:hypothetical protein
MIEKIITGFITILTGATLISTLRQEQELIGWTIAKDNQTTQTNSQRQTYLEYVQERKEVERLMRG